MRGLSLLGVLLALLVLGLLLRQHLQPGAVAPIEHAPTDVPQARPAAGTPGEAQQVQTQVREALDQALQPRRMQDD